MKKALALSAALALLSGPALAQYGGGGHNSGGPWGGYARSGGYYGGYGYHGGYGYAYPAYGYYAPRVAYVPAYSHGYYDEPYYYGGYGGGYYRPGAAIAAGLIGGAIGAIAAGSHRGYYPRRAHHRSYGRVGFRRW